MFSALALIAGLTWLNCLPADLAATSASWTICLPTCLYCIFASVISFLIVGSAALNFLTGSFTVSVGLISGITAPIFGLFLKSSASLTIDENFLSSALVTSGKLSGKKYL
jgi:hypothetical protein